MNLRDFLLKYKDEILQLSQSKTRTLAGVRGDSVQLKLGLPLFFDQLVHVLEQKLENPPPMALLSAAAKHGEEYLRLGYSLSHVVHAYGAMCQAITEFAVTKNAKFSASEFNILNGCLDVAIAAAVSEFQFRSVKASEDREVQHLGFLAHELRNALSSAVVAHEMIKAGLVGTGGSTASVLESNLSRMRNLIDRSLSEVRTRADAELFVEKFRLSDLFDQIALTAKVDADKKKQTLVCEVDWQVEIEADRQFILSAVANLVQNAIKYSKTGGEIKIRAKFVADRTLIEVEDQCGGIAADQVANLFKPYVQSGEDRSGMGLGLAITQRAVHVSQGTISVQNNPGTGCTFKIDIPSKITPNPDSKTTVPGVDSVQPDLRQRK